MCPETPRLLRRHGWDGKNAGGSTGPSGGLIPEGAWNMTQGRQEPGCPGALRTPKPGPRSAQGPPLPEVRDRPAESRHDPPALLGMEAVGSRTKDARSGQGRAADVSLPGAPAPRAPTRPAPRARPPNALPRRRDVIRRRRRRYLRRPERPLRSCPAPGRLGRQRAQREARTARRTDGAREARRR